ncbi:MAG: M28 family peptidase [Candidatus Hydrogenedentota bacterium]
MKLTSNAVTTFIPIVIILILIADFGMKKYALDKEDDPSESVEFSLLDIARTHVEIAEADQDRAMLWGRLGGSESERDSARLLAIQLSPYSRVEPPESVEFEAYRPLRWNLSLSDGSVLLSAVPAPFDAWFPNLKDTAIQFIADETDWTAVRGKWAFLEAEMPFRPSATSVREKLLYQKAVESGAAGFIFSLPHPAGDWKTAVPVDKPFTKFDTFFPDHRRPIPSFCISSDDGKRLRASLEASPTLASTIEYAEETKQKGINTIATLEGEGEANVILAVHLDAFFSGAVDDASGIAVLVGLARALEATPPESRRANFTFVGLSAHHDEGAGIRAFVAEDPERINSTETFILLEHLDNHHGNDAGKNDWPENLNDFRGAYIGPNGWPGIDDKLENMVIESGLMTELENIRLQCIADLFVVCDQLQPFTLIQSPPYYHTNHDTIDKLTEQGLQNALEFHLRLLEEAGYITRD